MSFDFKCELCKKEVKQGRKFSVDSTEWETEHTGAYGGIDEEYVCIDCRNKVQKK